MVGGRDEGVDPTRIVTKTDFGAALTELREGASLTIDGVVKETQIPRSTVGGYFTGASTPDLQENLDKVLRACGVSDQELIKQWHEALRRVRKPPGKRLARGPNPYRGLERYEREHAPLFCGRDKLTEKLVGLVAERSVRGGLIVVVGPSGSGKSSLLRAGLIAQLADGEVGVQGSEEWPRLLLTLAPGQHPLRELASELAVMTGALPSVVYEALRSNPVCCADLARQVCVPSADNARAHGEELGRRLVLIVDQIEELFAPHGDGADSAAFIAALDAAANRTDAGGQTQSPAAVVVLGLRADFFSQAARNMILATGLQDGQLLVEPMTEQDLRQAITEPARKARGCLEDGLVELLLRDLRPTGQDLSGAGADAPAHEAGALPLLSHALAATWELPRRADGFMTIAGYKKIGGISGAIAQSGDEAYEQLTDPQKKMARQLFLRLVRVGADTPDTLRRVAQSELVDGQGGARSDELAAVLDQFVDRRLITVDSEHVEIAHKALLTEWPTLRSWIDSDRLGLAARCQLTDAARDWTNAGRNQAYLYRGGRLTLAQEWVAEPVHRGDLNPLEREFLRASIEGERRRTRRRHQFLAVVVVLALLAFAGAAYARVQRSEALAQRNVAVSRQVAMEANLLRGSDPALAAQLALIAYRTAPTAEARSSLLDTFSGPTATRALDRADVRQTVAFTRDGSLMATGGADAADPSLRLWSLADRHHPRVLGPPFAGPTGAVLGLAFSPDGRRLVAGGEDQKIRVWNVTDPTKPVQLGEPTAGPGGTVFSVDYSPDGRTLAVGGADHTVRLYDNSDPGRLALVGESLTGSEGPVESVAFSPDSAVLAAGGIGGTVRLWNVIVPAAPALLGQPLTDLGTVLGIAFSPDGRILAAGGADKTVRLWNLTNPSKPLALDDPLRGPTGLINYVTFSGDGHSLAAASSDNNVWVWDFATHRIIATLPHPGPVTAVRFLDGEGTTLASTATDGATRIWAVPGPVITGPTDIVFTAKIGSDGRILLVGHDGHTQTDPTNQKVRLWDISNPRRPTPLSPPMGTPGDKGLSGAAALSPDRHTVAAGTLAGPVHLWDVSNPSEPVPLQVPLTGSTDNIESISFSQDGKTLAVASDDHTVRLWDLTDPRRPAPLVTLDKPAGPVNATTFSADGRLLAAASSDKKVWLWDVSNRERPFLLGGGPLTGPSKPVYSVAFSRDGRTLAAGSEDKTVRLWDLSDPRQPTPLGDHLGGPNNTIFWLTFSPNMRFLAAGGGDGTVWMWDLADRRRPVTYATLTALPGAVWSVSFSPDGHTLAAGGASHTARLWETDPEAVARYICAVSGDTITSVEWNQHIPALDYAPPCRR